MAEKHDVPSFEALADDAARDAAIARALGFHRGPENEWRRSGWYHVGPVRPWTGDQRRHRAGGGVDSLAGSWRAVCVGAAGLAPQFARHQVLQQWAARLLDGGRRGPVRELGPARGGRQGVAA